MGNEPAILDAAIPGSTVRPASRSMSGVVKCDFILIVLLFVPEAPGKFLCYLKVRYRFYSVCPLLPLERFSTVTFMIGYP